MRRAVPLDDLAAPCFVRVTLAPAVPFPPRLCYDSKAMPQGLRELVGRAMIDPEFLADLQRAPDAMLAEFQLSDDERTTVAQALEKIGSNAGPPACARAS